MIEGGYCPYCGYGVMVYQDSPTYICTHCMSTGLVSTLLAFPMPSGDPRPVPRPTATIGREWHRSLRGRRCRARLSRDDPGGGYFGRCDLVRGHENAHALERGMMVVTWVAIVGTGDPA